MQISIDADGFRVGQQIRNREESYTFFERAGCLRRTAEGKTSTKQAFLRPVYPAECCPRWRACLSMSRSAEDLLSIADPIAPLLKSGRISRGRVFILDQHHLAFQMIDLIAIVLYLFQMRELRLMTIHQISFFVIP